MTNQEALAYIDRLWNKYGALYSDEKNAEHEEEAELMQKYFEALGVAKEAIKAPSELEKNSQKLEKNFGELDCISRSDAIRIASGYCHPTNVAKELAKLPSVTPQEPILDKLRAEIERQEKWLMDAGYNQYNVDIALDTMKSVVDKCKAESVSHE